MPSETSPGSTSNRRGSDRVRADHGEDPGRWLDCDLLARPSRVVFDTNERGHVTSELVADTDVDPAGRMVEDRIKSITDADLLAAWEAVERNLARLDDREPREVVLRWIDERRAELPVEAGERIERPSTASSAVWPEREDGQQATVATTGGSS